MSELSTLSRRFTGIGLGGRVAGAWIDCVPSDVDDEDVDAMWCRIFSVRAPLALVGRSRITYEHLRAAAAKVVAEN
jgi:hypothetical protein